MWNPQRPFLNVQFQPFEEDNMIRATEVNDPFSWWSVLGIVVTLVVFCLSPFLAYIGELVFL
jgi:hypothetical protein